MSESPTATGGLRAYGLRCDYRTEPLGVDTPSPRLHWSLTSDHPGDRATAHRIVVRSHDAHDPLWDTGWVTDDGATEVRYAGAWLAPHTRYHWRLELRDAAGRATPPVSSWFETGHDAWQGRWIRRDPNRVPPAQPPRDDHSRSPRTARLTPPVRFRREFTLDTAPTRARAYVTAHGVYELRVNGERVGDAELAPGWTDYHARLHYQTYDVTELLGAGRNAIAVTVADGWWCGYVGADPRRAALHYGTAPELLLDLAIESAAGRIVIGTDAGWRCGSGEIRYADLLMGEWQDARLATPGWDRPRFPDPDWAPAVLAPATEAELVADPAEPIRVVDRRPAKEISQTPDAVVADFGQNIAGRVRLTVRGAEPGVTISVRHAETVGPDGALYTDNLRTAQATDVYVTAGHAVEVFEPRFTVHGFRYAEVTGYPGGLARDDIQAAVLHSDVPLTGRFACSNDLVNRLAGNIFWGLRGNIVGLPTDCPQRDERQGWTADAQVFLPTATRFADLAAFTRRWLWDVRNGQSADGAFPDLAPMLGVNRPEGAPGWGDAGVLMPWELWRTYGDREILATSYPGMVDWIDHVHRHNPDLVWRNAVGNHYGDWLEVDAHTPRDLVATAYFARSTGLLARIATELGHTADARRYTELAADIRVAFAKEFAESDGTVGADTQCGYLMALAWELLPDELVAPAFERLVTAVERRGNRLTTGFLGLPLLCPVLAAHGRADLAYAVLLQEEYPSWGYSIRHGATTVWERWDGWTETGGFGPAAMNSFNHYALGAVGDWLYGGVAGIGQAADSVGFSDIVIAPVLGGGLTWAEASQETVRGRIAVRWELGDGRLTVILDLPPGNDSLLVLPGFRQRIASGAHRISVPAPTIS